MSHMASTPTTSPSLRVTSPPENQSEMLEESCFFGPISPASFLERFLGPAQDHYTADETRIKNILKGTRASEGDMCTRLASAIEGFLPNYKVVATSNKSNSRIVLYRGDDAPDTPGNTDFTKARTWVQCKTGESWDAFTDPVDGATNSGHQFESQTDKGKSTREKLLACASEHFRDRYITHTFSVLLCGKTARPIRWDLAGAKVTSTFNYTKDPKPLAEFFWRFNSLSEMQAGVDEHSRPATRVEIKKALSAFNVEGSETTFVTLTVPNVGAGDHSAQCVTPGLSSATDTSNHAPFIHGTRSGIALDLKKGTKVYIEDSWEEEWGWVH